MKTIILAGGRGSRLSEETAIKPKPMVNIGDEPILWHIINIYAAFGFKEFVIALGYKGEEIKDYFLNFYMLKNDFSIDLSNGLVKPQPSQKLDWKVHLVHTGEATETGGRIKRLQPLIGDNRFMLTYGDGVANVDIKRLVSFHESHGKFATVTAVRPSARFGRIIFDGDRVSSFTEKAQTGEGWINGGFFVLEPEVFDYIEGDETIWEREPLERLAADGQLVAYKHEGFWQPMDTLREKLMLNELWSSGQAPWKIWE